MGLTSSYCCNALGNVEVYNLSKDFLRTVKAKVQKVEDFGNFKLLTATMKNFTIKSKIEREKPISNDEVNLYIPAEKCCVYEDEKLI